VIDLSQRYDNIIIDAGGRDSAELRYSLGVADQIIIPLRPTQLDTWTLEQMSHLVEQARTLNTGLEASVVLNMVSTNISNTDVEDTVSVIQEYEELKLFNTQIKERVAFQRSVREGQTVSEYKPRDTKAHHEIERLYKEVFTNGR
jgi:chromosome partitioning protein